MISILYQFKHHYLTKKQGLILMLGLAILILSYLAPQYILPSEGVTLQVLDQDKSDYSQALIETLDQENQVNFVDQRRDADAVLVIKAGYGSALQGGQYRKLLSFEIVKDQPKVSFIQDQVAITTLKNYVYETISSKSIGLSKEEFLSSYEDKRSSSKLIDLSYLETQGVSQKYSLQEKIFLWTLSLLILFRAFYSGIGLAREKSRGIFTRFLLGKRSPSAYLLQRFVMELLVVQVFLGLVFQFSGSNLLDFWPVLAMVASLLLFTEYLLVYLTSMDVFMMVSQLYALGNMAALFGFLELLLPSATFLQVVFPLSSIRF